MGKKTNTKVRDAYRRHLECFRSGIMAKWVYLILSCSILGSLAHLRPVRIEHHARAKHRRELLARRLATAESHPVHPPRRPLHIFSRNSGVFHQSGSTICPPEAMCRVGSIAVADRRHSHTWSMTVRSRYRGVARVAGYVSCQSRPVGTLPSLVSCRARARLAHHKAGNSSAGGSLPFGIASWARVHDMYFLMQKQRARASNLGQNVWRLNYDTYAQERKSGPLDDDRLDDRTIALKRSSHGVIFCSRGKLYTTHYANAGLGDM